MRPFQKHAQSLGNGILEHRAAIGWDALKNLGFPFPPLEEQTRIADFLDRETARIDELIAKAKGANELLVERRQSLISAAVTGKLEVGA
jgi:type I restriction enzyme S subunit